MKTIILEYIMGVMVLICTVLWSYLLIDIVGNLVGRYGLLYVGSVAAAFILASPIFRYFGKQCARVLLWFWDE